MRSGTHPVSRPVVFRDRAAGFQLLTLSTLDAQRTVEWEDGATYPVVDVDISSASHPFYTGTSRVADTAGRVERFERRYGRTAAVRP
ncbi:MULTISPECIES: type B 50S ribosomal protein L31 [Streptomyces]|uniref:Large ribosomal subunit protein bL31B n=1 Tax=Streptomyces sviceus (strain ATCC 29083 / DSM 924 / JCM 4929 / NBRC 13980 / NCIMB 11184 / NRRL 5439 / UC 5370) TaxID=463191 RepID=B5HPM6_STRX2|nr:MULTISPECIES: type B 50S ribosomal protein L31 [Streptomyces]EDY54802.1 ribosomal protein L31 [Streptomyces sviceus ATCC 29083]MYT10604.1 type B 50S ribosomal protein L31 [Streptomyces sp. SID5470]